MINNTNIKPNILNKLSFYIKRDNPIKSSKKNTTYYSDSDNEIASTADMTVFDIDTDN